MKQGGKTGKWIAWIVCFCAALFPWTAPAEEAADRLPDQVLMQFYESSLFVGDSQVRNFRNYIKRLRNRDPDFFPGVKCYAEYNLQMRMLARKDPVNDEETVQLVYKGRKATLTGIAKAEKPRNVFILIGLNDRIYEHMDRAENYFGRIVALRDEEFPETDLYFLSMTPVTSKWRQSRRDAIVVYNEWLQEKCEQTDRVFYMDIRAGLTDEEGCLPKKLTTDAESHLNADGFDLLVRNLLDYAQARYEEGTWEPAETAP